MDVCGPKMQTSVERWLPLRGVSGCLQQRLIICPCLRSTSSVSWHAVLAVFHMPGRRQAALMPRIRHFPAQTWPPDWGGVPAVQDCRHAETLPLLRMCHPAERLLLLLLLLRC